jgi:hypothetical protein
MALVKARISKHERSKVAVFDAGAGIVRCGRVPVAMDACAASGIKHASVQLPPLQASPARVLSFATHCVLNRGSGKVVLPMKRNHQVNAAR